MEEEKAVGSWKKEFSSFLQRIRRASALCTSAADSGTMGGHLPHDLLHCPDESAGGTIHCISKVVTAMKTC